MQPIDNLIDLTLLNEQASPEALAHLVEHALQRHVAAVCVYPKHLQIIPKTLRRATVLNFPSGQQSHESVVLELSQLLKEELADEIDYVFAYPDYLAGHTREALAQCQEIYQICATHQRKLKVILETGAFSSTQLIYTLSLELIEQGCDFLKTSTGKISTGATLEAASAMLSAIQTQGKPCGIKVSGGIRTQEQALDYIHLAEETLGQPVDATWFRIGTSGLK